MKRIIYLTAYLLNLSYICLSQAPSNDTCDNALLLMCDETLTLSPYLGNRELDDFGCGRLFDPDLWYVIEGNDQLFTFDIIEGIMDIHILEGSCDSPCIERFALFPNSFPTFTIKFNQGVDYYISINSVAFRSEVSLTTSCITVAENDECEDAIPITCGNQYTVNTSLAAPTNQENDCISRIENDLWYSFTATSNLLRIEHINGDQTNVSGVIYETDNCLPDPILCNDFSFADDFIETIPVVNGANYLIRLLSNTQISQGSEFTFQLNCVDFDVNTTCLTAQPFYCGDTLVINSNLVNPNGQNMECQSEVGFFPPSPIIGSWYSFEGFDNDITFSVPEGDFFSDLYVRVSNNLCSDNISCTDEFFVQSINDSNYSFFAEANVIYYFNFLPFNGGHRDFDHVQIICNPETNPNKNNIPTMDEWSLLILALILLIVSVISVNELTRKNEKNEPNMIKPS